MGSSIKFYAKHNTKDNYLYTFKCKDIFEANDAKQRILNKFENVRAIYFVQKNGVSMKIYAKK